MNLKVSIRIVRDSLIVLLLDFSEFELELRLESKLEGVRTRNRRRINAVGKGLILRISIRFKD